MLDFGNVHELEGSSCSGSANSISLGEELVQFGEFFDFDALAS